MSRTNRNIQYVNINARRVRHRRYLSNEIRALEELADFGYQNNSTRLQNSRGRIVTDYDDITVSAYSEIYHG